jgi:hypothetical protein
MFGRIKSMQLMLMFIALIIILVSSSCRLFDNQEQLETRTFSEVVDAANRGALHKIIVLEDNRLRVFYKDGLEIRSFVPEGNDIKAQLEEAGVPEDILSTIEILYEQDD